MYSIYVIQFISLVFVVFIIIITLTVVVIWYVVKWILLKWTLVCTAISARLDGFHVYLITNTREIYKNHHFVHAEEAFMDDYRNKDRSKVTHIWIKSSPCTRCAREFKQFFQNCRVKPTISVGRIYDFGNDNCRALRELVNDGFKIVEWRFMVFLLYCYSIKTKRHLEYIYNMRY